MSDSEQSITIRVWLKGFLVGGARALPRATSLMQKNTSWRCFVRCFYIKHFSSIVLSLPTGNKVHLFSNGLQERNSARRVKVFPHGPWAAWMLEHGSESAAARHPFSLPFLSLPIPRTSHHQTSLWERSLQPCLAPTSKAAPNRRASPQGRWGSPRGWHPQLAALTPFRDKGVQQVSSNRPGW